MRSDPWEEFLLRAGDRPVVGYLERGTAPGLSRPWAAWYTEAVDTFRLRSGDSPDRLDRATRARFRSGAARAIVGYVGFDAFSIWEPLLAHRPKGASFPLGEFAVVHDLHRVLAAQVGRGAIRLRVHREDPHVGRDVAVEQFELEVHEDRTVAGDIELEPVEPRASFPRVIEVIDVVGRSVHIAAEDDLVGVLPRVVRLGLECRPVGGGNVHPCPFDLDCEGR